MMLLIERSRCKYRFIRNHVSELEPFARRFVREHGWIINLHTDRMPFRPVREQLTLFMRASFIVGPHGAAFVNTLSAAPRGSCVVEFHSVNKTPQIGWITSISPIFMRLARLLGHHYVGLPLFNLDARMADLDDALARCIRALSTAGRLAHAGQADTKD